MHRSGSTASRRLIGFIAVGLGLGTALVSWVSGSSQKPTKRASRPDPRKLALELHRGLGLNRNEDEIGSARAISEALTTFLERLDGRTPGVLTPPEAREGIERVTGDRDLARSAEELVLRRDRVRFGMQGGDEKGLIGEGRGLFERIAEVMGKKRGKGGPREAVVAAAK